MFGDKAPLSWLLGFRGSLAPMETATRASVIRERLEEIFDEHQDVDSKVYRGADNP